MIGLSATQVDEMSLWQLTAQSEGYADAHTPKEKRGMTEAEFKELSDLVDEG